MAKTKEGHRMKNPTFGVCSSQRGMIKLTYIHGIYIYSLLTAFHLTRNLDEFGRNGAF